MVNCMVKLNFWEVESGKFTVCFLGVMSFQLLLGGSNSPAGGGAFLGGGATERRGHASHGNPGFVWYPSWEFRVSPNSKGKFPPETSERKLNDCKVSRSFHRLGKHWFF